MIHRLGLAWGGCLWAPHKTHKTMTREPSAAP